MKNRPWCEQLLLSATPTRSKMPGVQHRRGMGPAIRTSRADGLQVGTHGATSAPAHLGRGPAGVAAGRFAGSGGVTRVRTRQSLPQGYPDSRAAAIPPPPRPRPNPGFPLARPALLRAHGEQSLQKEVPRGRNRPKGCPFGRTIFCGGRTLYIDSR